MCRLVLMNKQGEKEIDKRYGLERYFRYLENRLGGDGNGFIAVKNKKIVAYSKGLRLDVKYIADTLKNTQYDWAIFHTRLATIGEKADKNCHPFVRGNNIIAMNGTEQSVSFLSTPKDMSDTEAILDILDKYNLDITALSNFTSIFVGFQNGEPYMVAGNTRNIKLLLNKSNNATVFASEFPKNFNRNIYEFKNCCIWKNEAIDNTLITKYKPVKKIDIYDLYDIYDVDELYGQYYFKDANKEGDKYAV